MAKFVLRNLHKSNSIPSLAWQAKTWPLLVEIQEAWGGRGTSYSDAAHSF
jgi:hypothetical protein